MARVEGVDPEQTSFPMRQVFEKVRKMLGRDFTPQKIAARVPRVFWINALAEWLLGRKRRSNNGSGCCWHCGPRCGLDVRSESMPILPEAECTV